MNLQSNTSLSARFNEAACNLIEISILAHALGSAGMDETLKNR